MKKYSRLPMCLLAICVFLSSCKDDEPATAAKLSFAESEMAVLESDGTIEIEIKLDKPATEDITIHYTLDGTALDVEAAGENFNPDYEVLGEYLEVEIEKGETTGVIEIDLYSDFLFEDSETIEIEIDDVDGGGVEITNMDDIEITIEQEDGMAIVLDWPEPNGGAQADMDLVLRMGETAGSLAVVAASANGAFTQFEVVFVPSAVPNRVFGVSYNYYDGTLDPLEFEAIFFDYANGVLEPEANAVKYTGTYTAANKNKWTNISTTLVVQTFESNAGQFTNFSQIEEPMAGSRLQKDVRVDNNGSIYYPQFDSFVRTKLK